MYEDLFLLDSVPRTGRLDKRDRFVASFRHVKRFRVGPELVASLVAFAKNADLVESMRPFAKPPFESCYVEYDVSASSPNASRAGVLWVENSLSFFAQPKSDPDAAELYDSRLISLPDGYRFDPGNVSPPETEELQIQEKQAALFLALITEVLWLLMHRPGTIRLQAVKGRQTVKRGKLRPARAHTVLSIDLATKDLVKRIVADGSRGSGVREHEVRGTWVHLHHVRSCVHKWEKVARPEFAPERWSCPCCGTMRVWRKDHVRGEHNRGNVFHTYEVKDSRLETADGRH